MKIKNKNTRGLSGPIVRNLEEEMPLDLEGKR